MTFAKALGGWAPDKHVGLPDSSPSLRGSARVRRYGTIYVFQRKLNVEGVRRRVS